MHLIIPTLLVSSLVTGGLCQEILLENMTFISPCTHGARMGMDRFLIFGSIGENVTAHIAQNWQKEPQIFLVLESRHSVALCSFTIEGSTCTDKRCPCVYDTRTDQVRFSINDTTIPELNNAVIHGKWEHANSSIIFSNRNFTLKDFYDVNTANLTLKIYGLVGTLDTGGACNFTLKLNFSNHLELCCSKMATPCYPQISFNGAVLAKDVAQCVNFASAFDGVTGNLTLSYSVCTKTDYASRGYCRVSAAVATTTSTENSSQPTEVYTPSPSSTAKTKIRATTAHTRAASYSADGDEGKSCPFHLCHLYLAFTLLILEVLGGVAYGIIWFTLYNKDEDETSSTVIRGLDNSPQESRSPSAKGISKTSSRQTLERPGSRRGFGPSYFGADRKDSTPV